jgi:hypothetical protein
MQSLLRSHHLSRKGVVAKSKLRAVAGNSSVVRAANALHPAELLSAAKHAAEKGAEVIPDLVRLALIQEIAFSPYSCGSRQWSYHGRLGGCACQNQ